MITEKIKDLNKTIVENDLYSLPEIFHENSKINDIDTDFFYNIEIISKIPYILRKMAKSFKTYPGYPSYILSKEEEDNILKTLIKERRSERTYSGDTIGIQKLADLLYVSLGITSTVKGTNDIELPLRAYPSAGALYPIETYISVFNVDGLDKGIYHYNVINHTLELIVPGNHKENFAKICLAEDIIENANILIILTAIFKRVTIKYGIRGHRFALIEAGITGQNLTLVAESLGLGSCMLGGFFDDEIHKVLDVDGVNEAVVNVMTVGCKKGDVSDRSKGFDKDI